MKGVIYISAKKKKPARKADAAKWHKVHFFKRKKSTRRQVGHPAYVYQTSGKKPNRSFKYLTITHTPKNGKENQYEKLKHNIDPKEKSRVSYVKKYSSQAPENTFQEPDRPYRIHKDDTAVIKKYTK